MIEGSIRLTGAAAASFMIKVGLHIVSRATYYTYVIGDEKKQRKISNELKTLTFRQYSVPSELSSTSHLVQNLYPTVFKKPKKSRGGKGVDIQMTLDIMTNVYQDKLDTVYMVSGDGDFIPLIKECIRLGKQVHVAALSSGLNPDLPNVADKFISLDDMYFSK